MTKTIEAPVFTLPGIEDITRRDFLVGGAGLLALGLAGCRNETGGSPDARTKVVEDGDRRVEIPVSPERVLVLDGRDPLEISLTLGLPVSAVPADPSLPEDAVEFPAYAELDSSTERIPYAQSEGINIEAIAVNEPDLIFGMDVYFPDYYRYDRLEPIAPVINVTAFRPWREQLRRFGEVFERPERAERAVREFDAERDALDRRLGEIIRSNRLAIVTPNADGTFFLGATLLIDVLSEFGALELEEPYRTPDGTRAWDEFFYRSYSGERLDVLEVADVIILRQYADGDGGYTGFDALKSNPLWKRLPAVEAGRVLERNGLWINNGSIYCARYCLDTVERAYEMLA
jgi:ABC-type Fe3+-hydroxamate transport system substrate-binding protein